MIMQFEKRKGTSNLSAVKRIGAHEVRNNFSDLIALVYYSGEIIVIEQLATSSPPFFHLICMNTLPQKQPLNILWLANDAPKCYKGYAFYSKTSSQSQPLRRFPKQK